MARFRLIILSLIFCTSGAAAQVNFSVLTTIVKYDYYSIGGDAINYGVEYRGNRHVPDIQFQVEYKGYFAIAAYNTNRFSGERDFGENTEILETYGRVKAFRLMLGKQIYSISDFSIGIAGIVQRNFDSTISYTDGVTYGWESFFWFAELSDFSAGGAILLDYAPSSHFFLRLESSLTRYSHNDARYSTMVKYSHLNLLSSSLRVGYTF